MAGNSKDSKILAYKDMINQLNKTISTQTELIQSLQKTLEADPTWEQELPDDITVPEHKRKARRTHADLFKNVPSCDHFSSRGGAKLSNLRNADGMYWERIRPP